MKLNVLSLLKIHIMATNYFGFFLPITFGVALLIGCDRSAVSVGGGYPAVTPARLAGLTSSFRTGQHDFKFSWTFDTTSFVIEGSNIPPDLIVAMLGPGMTTAKIEGAWEIRDGVIHFFVDKEDSNSANECAMRIYCTGPIRIETPDAQYVF
jgi:hypothetical protein